MKTPLRTSNSSRHCPTADGHRVQRVGRDHDRHAGLVLEPRRQTVQQRAAAGDDDAALHDVGGEFGRGLVERDLDGVDDGRDRFLDRLANLAVYWS